MNCAASGLPAQNAALGSVLAAVLFEAGAAPVIDAARPRASSREMMRDGVTRPPVQGPPAEHRRADGSGLVGAREAAPVGRVRSGADVSRSLGGDSTEERSVRRRIVPAGTRRRQARPFRASKGGGSSPGRRRVQRRGGRLGRISTRLYSARSGERSRSITTSATSSAGAPTPSRAEPRPNSVFTLPGIRYETRMLS